MEFVGGMDPIEYFSVQNQSQDDMIDLQEIGFTFAVEQIGPEVGTIKAS